MSLRRYHEYKNVGSGWLSLLPSHWALEPLKLSFQIVSGATPKSDNADFWDGDIPWLTPSDLNASGWLVNRSNRTISLAGLESCAASLVPAGSVVLSTRAPIGSIGITAVNAATNQGCKSLVTKGQSSPRWLAYVLTAGVCELQALGRGTTFPEISSEELSRFSIPVPPRAEQKFIVAFLDRETAKIDALVAEQERLIALLKEKRQAVISHAVTKGLDPSAPLKDTGVPWLGSIPAHWDVEPIRSLARLFSDGDWIESPYITDDGIRLIQTGNIGVGQFREQGFRFISNATFDALACTEVKPGDV